MMKMLPLMERSMILMQKSMSLKLVFLQAVVLSQGNKMTRPRKRLKERHPVESFTGYRDLSDEFEDCSDNNINEVNATGTIVPIVGQHSPNSTNTFSVAGLSNNAASPTYGKSSFIDASQLSKDPDMPELGDITYSDDEDDVGAEVDFNNLETSITVSLILTIRVHKDHLVSQIIGDLSSTTQTRSVTRVVKDQGGLSQMFNDDFYTYFSDNSINEVNAAGTLVPIIGQISLNSINTFSAAGPSNIVACPTHGKSSCIDAS
nr:hypothetical protein [Tanacetum cinerariifolium]